MAGSRLELVFGDTPPKGRLLLIGAGAASDLDRFDPARTQVVQRLFPEFAALKARGLAPVTAPEGDFDAAVVFLPRARAEARARIAQAAAHLQSGGWLLLEHGYDQAEAVRMLLLSHGFEDVQSRLDLGGHERISLGRLP